MNAHSAVSHAFSAQMPALHTTELVEGGMAPVGKCKDCELLLSCCLEGTEVNAINACLKGLLRF